MMKAIGELEGNFLLTVFAQINLNLSKAAGCTEAYFTSPVLAPEGRLEWKWG